MGGGEGVDEKEEMKKENKTNQMMKKKKKRIACTLIYFPEELFVLGVLVHLYILLRNEKILVPLTFI